MKLVYHIPTGNNQSLRAAGKTSSNPGEQLDAKTEVVHNLITDADETQRCFVSHRVTRCSIFRPMSIETNWKFQLSWRV